MKRTPAVAGHFYSGSAGLLDREVGGLVDETLPKSDAIGVLSPHAGLVYSGKVAGLVYSSITMPDVFVILGPNHTGLGADISVMASGTWEMPNGPVEVDGELAASILEGCPGMESDTLAHLREHSIEVQLPFIQHFARNVAIVPITIMSGRYESLQALGEAIGRAVEASDRRVTIVASSDMTHYEPDKVAREKDRMALDRVLAVDPRGLYQVVREKRISMCGYAPAIAMLVAALHLGATTTEEVMYMTSGDVNRDYSSVVGYAGVVIR